jgi:hypothetical protein
MLPNTLVTNEIKNSAGTEIEFSRLSTGPGRVSVFRAVLETPALQHRLTIKHLESGSGLKLRRRSLIRFDKTVVSTVDLITPVTISGYTVIDAPIGALAAITEVTNVNAELMSFHASLGASTTILYDGTGNGSVCLLQGDL